jgi:ribosomal-protein-alanine N-acetyltransferase
MLVVRAMADAFLVRAAQSEGRDPEAILSIDRLCFSQGTINVAAELERSWARVWVVREKGEDDPRAFLLAWLVVDELHVLSVATLPSFRRRGMARALLEHAIGFARDHKVRTILLEVRRSNAAAIRLYRAFGFSATAVRPRYYADNFEDAVEMSLVLDPATGAIVAAEDAVSI